MNCAKFIKEFVNYYFEVIEVQEGKICPHCGHELSLRVGGYWYCRKCGWCEIDEKRKI